MEPLNILMIEDNEQDVLLLSDALTDAGMVKSLTVATNGKEAIKILHQLHDSETDTLPDIILLDINMPIMDGHETLEYIKTNNDLKHIPTIILTTSASQADIRKAYDNHSNSYIVKPYEIADLENIVLIVKDYWVNVVQLSK
jgi:CheY-like chemotaxis protein